MLSGWLTSSCHTFQVFYLNIAERQQPFCYVYRTLQGTLPFTLLLEANQALADSCLLLSAQDGGEHTAVQQFALSATLFLPSVGTMR